MITITIVRFGSVPSETGNDKAKSLKPQVS